MSDTVIVSEGLRDEEIVRREEANKEGVKEGGG